MWLQFSKHIMISCEYDCIIWVFNSVVHVYYNCIHPNMYHGIRQSEKILLHNNFTKI